MNVVQVVACVASRDALHGRLKRLNSDINARHLPSFFNNGIAIINIDEKKLPELKDGINICGVRGIESYRNGQKASVGCTFSLNRKSGPVEEKGGKRKRVGVDAEGLMPEFLERIGCEAYGVNGHRAVIAPEKPLTTSKFVSYNVFSANIDVVIIDAEKFNNALVNGYGCRGSYGFGLLRVL